MNGEPAAGPRLDSPIKLTISYTHTCNLDCRMCYADCTAERSPRELSCEEWIAFIDRIEQEGIISLYFEGGEPLHRPDFLDVLRHCSRKMLAILRTNGTLLTPELARELKACGLASVLVDVMGAEAATHDALVGVPGSHARTLAGIRAALDAGLNTQMLTILNRRNIGELQGWVDLAQRIGVRTIGILRPYPIGRARRNWSDFALSIDAMMAALRALQIPPGMKLMQSWHPNDANCCWQMAAVNAHGDSIGCAYLREFVHYGNIRDMTLSETWNHPLSRRLRGGAVSKSCTACTESQGSRGGCRSTAYAFHGRWDAPDPFDITLNDGVDLRVLPDWMLQENPGPPDPARA